MRQTNVRGTLSLRGFRKLRTGAIVATGVILLGLGFLAPTVSASEQDGVWIARTVAEVKADIQKEGDLFKYVIKWGDTLSVISEASNIPVDVLQEMNQTSGKNLFLPHNELYFTEAETISDTVTKHKIVIKESGASGEVRTYEVLLKKDQETKAVTFELTDVTEKVEKMVVNYSPVYQPVSAPVVERAEESGEELASEAPAADKAPSNIGTTNQPVASNPSSEAPAPKAEVPVTPAPKVEAPLTPMPKAEEPAAPALKADESAATTPKADEPAALAPKAEAPASPAPKAEAPSTPAPKAEAPSTPAPKAEVPVTPAPKVEAPSTPMPKAEEPSTPAPKVEEPASSAPKAEEPAATEPKTEEPVATTPKVEEPTTPAPKAEEPESPAPKAEEPSTPSPKVEEPSTPAPKVEEPSTPSPKVEEPSTPSPKVEEPAPPAPKADEPVGPAPKAEESAASAPKDDESGSSVESPSTGNHSDESGTPSETPTGDSTSSLDASGEPNFTEQPAGESGKSETTSEPSNTPSAEATNDSGNTATSSPVTDGTTSNTGTTEQPETSAPKTEATAPKEDKLPTNQNGDTSNPVDSKDETPNPAPAPKEDTPSEEVAPKDEKLEEAKKDGKDVIEKIVASKHSEIEKVKDEAEKTKLKEKLNELKEEALAAIKNAENHDAAVDATDEYQTKIDEINVPGEELPAPNYNKDNLTNGRNEGTTIDNGSTAIGHGSGEAPTQPSSTSEGTSSFRNAPSVQARARRVARSTSEPDGTVNISYNFAEMPDIHGFLSDPGENNTVTIPAGTSEAQAKELVKEKIQAKIKDLAARGYHVKNDIIFEQDTTVKNYNYVVTFTKEATGTSGFRMAPAVQPRASRNRRSLEQPVPQKVKVNVFYNFDQMKDIAGFLGDINGTSLEIVEGLSNEQVKAAVKSQVEAKKEELSKRGYTFKEDYVYQSNGKDYNYVVTFSKAAK